MKKSMLMEQLHICDATEPEIITEKLFCVAIINQGTEMAAKILKNYLELRSIWNGEDAP